MLRQLEEMVEPEVGGHPGFRRKIVSYSVGKTEKSDDLHRTIS
jgi:hypothetical protein